MKLGGRKMQEKRKRILKMLESGTISMDEALTLLENLHEDHLEEDVKQVADEKEPSFEVTRPVERKEQKQESKSTEDDKEEPSVDDFLNDLRKDFTIVGDRFMQFMQSAVQKVKEFDFEAPFGQSATFNHTMTKKAEGIEEVLVQIVNGKTTIHSSDDEEIRAEFTVKAHNQESEEAAKKDFLEKILFVTDEGKLRLISDMKMTQVNVDLYIPRKMYKKIVVKLTNGSFRIKETEVGRIHVKTANGRIEVSQLTFEEADFETANGTIYVNEVVGNTIETETLNGRIYIDGRLKEVEAQSLNGHVSVTTTSEAAEKIDAKTMSGTVELYFPSTLPLAGELLSSVGKIDLGLDDVERVTEQDQLFQRSVRFRKEVPGQTKRLHLTGEAKTGTVLVRYNI